MPKSNYHRGNKGRECYFCSEAERIEEHHIIPQRFDGPDERDNIVDVCSECHKKLESLYDSSFYRWFGIEDRSEHRRFHRSCVVERCSNTVDFEFIVPQDSRGRKTYLCLECAKEWFNKNWIHVVAAMASDGLDMHVSKEGAERVREYREENSHKYEEARIGPVSETGIRRDEIEKLGWDNIGVSRGDGQVIVVEDGELPGMDKFEVLVNYSLSFSPRIGERVEQ